MDSNGIRFLGEVVDKNKINFKKDEIKMGSKVKSFIFSIESICIVIVALGIAYFGVNWLLTIGGINTSWNFGLVLLVFFLLITLSMWVITKIEVPRSRSVRKISIIIFTILFILFSTIVIVIFKDKLDCYEQITTLISLVVSILTAFNVLNQDSLDLLPSVYNKDLKVENGTVTLDLSINCDLKVTISNFEKYPVKVAYMGIYSASEFKALKKESKDAQRKYLFLSSVAKQENLEYENVPALGISDPNDKKLDTYKTGIYYVVYADIFYKLHATKIKCINSIKEDSNESKISEKKGPHPLFAEPKVKPIVVSNATSIQIGGDNGEPQINVK